MPLEECGFFSVFQNPGGEHSEFKGQKVKISEVCLFVNLYRNISFQCQVQILVACWSNIIREKIEIFNLLTSLCL